MKPIINQFRAAGRLINEWRDTLLYTGLGALAVNNVVNDAGVSLRNVMLAASARELIRGVSWSNSMNKQIAGLSNKQSNRRVNHYTSLFMSTTIVLGESFLPPSPVPFSMHAAAGLWALFLAGGIKAFDGKLKDMPRYYFDKDIGMWDWPRKRGGDGGTTQTQKMLDGFRDMGSAIGRTLAPKPAFAPVAVRYAPNLNA